MSAFKLKRLEREISYLPELQRISSALRRLATAASRNHGSDCYIHSALAQVMLARLGIESKLVAGYAGWRLGNGDSDMVLHAPLPNMIPQPGIPYHVWLELDEHILDFTTYQLRLKAAQMDELDGGKTNVVWCPDFLFATKKSISPLGRVIQKRAGLYYYVREAALEAKIISAASSLDEDDIAHVWLLYRNQEIQVFGPCNMP
jgi:hypothetical protein